MFEAKSGKFGAILVSEVGGRTDKMAGLTDAGRIQVWTSVARDVGLTRSGAGSDKATRIKSVLVSITVIKSVAQI